MIEVLASWLIMLFISVILGKAGIRLLFEKTIGNNLNSFDGEIVFGLCICNLYSQIFSIFYKIGVASFIGLTVITAVALFYLKKGNSLNFLDNTIWEKLDKKRFVSIVIVLIGIVAWTSLSPHHYDTYLYHAQAIHWVEEYGVVPGLGNLHFRFAYNSAVMPLHALYSFGWIAGQSLHTVNGFLTAVLLIYIFASLPQGTEFFCTQSTFLKLGALFYVFYDAISVSSPNTDSIALLLTFYVIIKWTEFTEQNAQEAEYAFLCIVAVYIVTVKLSVGVFVLLTVYPAVLLIRKRQIKDILKYLCVGVIQAIPFVIRNVIISGYLLYPCKSSAIKGLDWIMPSELLESDKAEIIAWARGNKDISRIDESIFQWIGEWYDQINILWKVFVVLAGVAIIYLIFDVIVSLKGKNDYPYVTLYIVCVFGFFFWLLSAPLPRYGAIYMIGLPSIALARMISICRPFKRFGCKNVFKSIDVKIKYVVSISYCLLYCVCSIFIYGWEFHPVIQGDYLDNPTYMADYYGNEIAIPYEGDQTGYDPFPSIPYSGVLDGIILRGEELEDGFKQK